MVGVVFVFAGAYPVEDFPGAVAAACVKMGQGVDDRSGCTIVNAHVDAGHYLVEVVDGQTLLPGHLLFEPLPAHRARATAPKALACIHVDVGLNGAAS